MKNTKIQKWPKEKVVQYYNTHAHNAYMELFPILHHAIATENWELYRMARDAQSAIANVQTHYNEMLEKVGA